MARTRTGPTPAELALMSLLLEGPAHPYSLDAKLRRNGAPTEVAFSSIYAALDRLERLGLVASRADAGARGKARRVYRLTPAGRATLKSEARTALARPSFGPRSNDLGLSALLMLNRNDALTAVREARELIAEARRVQPSIDDEYPQNAVVLHQALLLAAEDRFYAELERLVLKSHPERARRRIDEDDE